MVLMERGPRGGVYLAVTRGYTYSLEQQEGGGCLPIIQVAVLNRKDLAVWFELKYTEPFA